jgi:glucose/mannose-6-phosphate isomerase
MSEPEMIDLDNADTYRRFDRQGMLVHLHDFPEQVRRAWQKVLEFELPPRFGGIDRVVVSGMGGSAIGGDILGGLALAESRVPVLVHRDYGLPRFVDGRTLVIFSSYSGNTEETLSAFQVSGDTPAHKLVVTTGGALKELAERDGVPVLLTDYKAPPRAAFPMSFIPLLGIMQKLGLLGDKSTDVREALRVLEEMSVRLSEKVARGENPAKQLALKLREKLAVVYGAEELAAVARRWKTQLNENAKTMAFFELFPELNHNAVMGYQFPAAVREQVFVVLLDSPRLNPRNRRRYEVTTRLLDNAGIRHETVPATGTSPLARVLSLVLFGDYVSFYLAMLNRTDPTSIEAINTVKDYLGRGQP